MCFGISPKTHITFCTQFTINSQNTRLKWKNKDNLNVVKTFLHRKVTGN